MEALIDFNSNVDHVMLIVGVIALSGVLCLVFLYVMTEMHNNRDHTQDKPKPGYEDKSKSKSNSTESAASSHQNNQREAGEMSSNSGLAASLVKDMHKERTSIGTFSGRSRSAPGLNTGKSDKLRKLEDHISMLDKEIGKLDLEIDKLREATL